VGHLIAALRAAGECDIYWSNEAFYQWLVGAGSSDVTVPASFAAMDFEFAFQLCPWVPVKTRLSLLQVLVVRGDFPGAAVALARWKAKAGQFEDALEQAQSALSSARQSGHRFDFHILENQITALERSIAKLPIPHAVRRYLGDDDGYLRERTCEIPFDNFTINEDGNTSVCCSYFMPGIKLGSVLEPNVGLQDVYNGKAAQALRQTVLDGSFRYCDLVKCPKISGGTLPLKREARGKNVQRGAVGGELIFEGPRRFAISFDLSCNLTCPSCRAHMITEKPELQRQKTEIIESMVMPLLRNVEILHLNSAGELFVSRPLRRLLSLLNRSDFPDLKLTMISNGTLFNRKEWEKFPGIHDMVARIRISTDAATKPTFEKLRRGGRWENFVDNVRFLSSLAADGVIGELAFSMTYQVDNFREMPAFVDMCRSFYPGALVIFEKLEDRRTYSAEEFRAKAVHHSSHPLHDEFLAILRDPRLDPKDSKLTCDYGYRLAPAQSSDLLRQSAA